MSLRFFTALVLVFVAFSSEAATRTWTGAAGNLWSNVNNWSPAGAPVNGDTLTFPVGAANLGNTNDIAGLSVGGLTFSAGGYTLGGNAIVLAGPYTSVGGNTLNIAMDVQANAVVLRNDTFAGHIDVNATGFRISNNINLLTTVSGGLDVHANPASIEYTIFSGGLAGSGSVSGYYTLIRGGGTFSGTLTGSGFGVYLDGVSLPGAQVGGAVFGGGSIGSLFATQAVVSPVGANNDGTLYMNFNAPTQLNTGNLTIGGPASFAIGGPTPGTGSSQINVTGTVQITSFSGGGPARLYLYGAPGLAPVVGQQIVLVKNDGNDPVSGTFYNYPEGSTITIGYSIFTLSYQGGDGNDITLTCTKAANIWTGAAGGLWSQAGNWSRGVPQSGDVLVFPSGAANLVNTNDIAGLSVGGLALDSGYTLNGNGIVINGAYTSSGGNTLNIPIDVRLAGASLGPYSSLDTLAAAVDINASGVTLTRFNFTGAVNVHTNATTMSGVSISGALSGTGPLALDGSISGSGTYSGTITVGNSLALNGASLPAANLISTTFAGVLGSGTIGALNAYVVYPSQTLNSSPSTGVAHGTNGVLNTGNLSITGNAVFQINGYTPGSGYSQISVNGSVSLSSATLTIVMDPALQPVTGQQFVLITNDGSDAVIGTFNGLAEGGLLSVNGQQYSISYRGGTGNDVTLTKAPTVRTWTGAVSDLWSQAGNWANGVPQSGDVLNFPQGAAHQVNTNDLTGLAISNLTIATGYAGTNYVLNGNGIILTGLPMITNGWVVNLPIDIRGNNLTFLNATLGGHIDVNGTGISFQGMILTGGLDVHANAIQTSNLWLSGSLDGTGAISVNDTILNVSGGYSGTISGPQIFLQSVSLPAATVSSGSAVCGNGTIGTLTAWILTPGQVTPLGLGYSPSASCSGAATLNVGNLSFGSAIGGSIGFVLNGATPGTGYSQVNVSGTVTINNANTSLFASAGPAFQPSPGQQFVLIHNSSAHPVSGTFRSLPEGSTLLANGYQYRLSYQGGTGGDLTLTALGSLPSSNITISSTPNPSTLNQNVTFNVSVSGGGATPTGTVTFSDGPNTLAMRSLVSGSASLTIAYLTAGTHVITAAYSGDNNYIAGTATLAGGQVVNAAAGQQSQTITFANPGTQAVGGSLSLVAQATSSLVVTFSSLTPSVCTVSGTAVSFPAAGTCTIAADQAGNSTYAAAPRVTQSFAVSTTLNQQSQTITFANPGAQSVGGTLNLTATATSGLAVVFSSLSSSVCTLNGVTASFVAAGTCTIAADQVGNGSYTAAPRVTQSFAVNAVVRQSQTITFAYPGVQTAGARLNLSATASSGLAVTFSSLTTSVCAVLGSNATFIGSGTCTIAADQAGNSAYSAALQVTQQFTVNAANVRQPQSIAFLSPGVLIVGAGPATLMAVASSGLGVTFGTTSPQICTVSGNTVTAVAAGACLLFADQSGNAFYQAAGRATTAATVFSAAQAPAPPTNLVCTAGVTSAVCNMTPPVSVGGGPITNYQLSCQDITQTRATIAGSSTLPVTIPNLPAGVSFSCQAQAVNSFSSSQSSAFSNFFTPLANANVPPAPSMNRAIAGNASALVAFTGPAANGGSAITSYTATSNPGGITGQCNAPCSSINVTGLSNGTSYTFTVTASNAAGVGTMSVASNAVIPVSNAGAAAPPLAQTSGAIDIDGNGKGQILLRSSNGQYQVGRLVNSQLQFSTSGLFDAGYRTIAFGDFNGDGRSDVAQQNTTQGEFGDVLISYSMDLSSTVTVRQVKLAWIVEAIADMDGDGYTDMVFRFTGDDGIPNDTGVSYVWFMKDSAVNQVRKRGGAPLSWTLLGATDVNGDLAADMVYIDPSNNIRVLMATPLRTCANVAAGSIAAGYQALKLANFTGRPAILHRNAGTGAVQLLTLDGSTLTLPPPTASPDDPNASCTSTSLQITTGIVSLATVNLAWQFYAAGDLNGDGYTDIVWKQPDGTLTVWLMGSSGVASTITNAGTAPAGYAVLQP